MVLLCSRCKSCFDSKEELASHFANKHEKKNSIDVPTSAPPSEVHKVHECTKCKQWFFTETELNIHMDNVLHCSKCKECFDSKEKWDAHSAKHEKKYTNSLVRAVSKKTIKPISPQERVFFSKTLSGSNNFSCEK